MAEVKNISLTQLLNIIELQFKAYVDQLQVNLPIVFKPYTPAESLQDIGLSVYVLYRVARREPAAMRGSPFSSEKFWTPRPMDGQVTDPQIVHTNVYMHMHENLLEFLFVSDSYSKACEQSDYFEDFMCLNREVLRKYGYPEILFWQRQTDNSQEVNGKVLYYVSQQYYVRTKRLVVSTESVIRNIEIVLKDVQTGG